MTEKFQDAYDKWMKPHERDEDMPMYPEAFEAGWKACKKTILENWGYGIRASEGEYLPRNSFKEIEKL